MKNSIHHRDIIELCTIHKISEPDKLLALGFLKDSYKASYIYIDYCINENKPVTDTFTDKTYKLFTKINNRLKQLKTWKNH